MIANYSSYKFFTSFFNKEEIQKVIENNTSGISSNVPPEVVLAKSTLSTIVTLLSTNTLFLFDQLNSASTIIENTDRIYLASFDSSNQFIDSHDNYSNRGQEFYEVIKSQVKVNENSLIELINDDITEYFILSHFQFESFSILMILETFRDSTIFPSIDTKESTEINYGYDILDENLTEIKYTNNPYTVKFHQCY